jgi:magnesium chelatase subunit I
MGPSEKEGQDRDSKDQVVSRPDPPSELPRTLGELRRSGWQSLPVHEELRRNAAARMAAGLPILEGVLGFETTVVPQLEHAILAGHDVILLGERGQAKTRIARLLVSLLDEWLPVVDGSELNDDPEHPVSRYARNLVADMGEATPIAWVHRSERYTEKLATPDTSISDLIGEVDPIKVAEGRYLSDELALHFGLLPRANRGIFALNELPDLAERIQVGLLNVLEERDIQIRGFAIRLPVDIILVATANPEDYTNRGRIITPLKDRFGAQIRTHYPRDVATEVAIVRQEARPHLGTRNVPGMSLPRVEVPAFMEEVVATISQLARKSPHLNQRSGISVRLSISNYETLVASALARALRLGEPEAAPRVSDLASLVASTQGKVEIEALEEGREDRILQGLVQAAVLEVFKERVSPELLGPVISAFGPDTVVHAGDDLPASTYQKALSDVSALRAPVAALASSENPAVLASAVELVLEGLHLTKRLNKEAAGAKTTYRARGG